MNAKELIEKYNAGERDFRGAYLTGADLERAHLSGADLRGAALGRADLRGAYLRGAILTGADLRGAILTGADLGRADLRGAYLRGADLRGAVGLGEIPIVADLDQKMADACSIEGALDMSSWHSCETTHCRAGWAIVLAGEAGRALEDRHGPQIAGALIYQASTGTIPDFFADDKEAMADIIACAKVAK